MKIYKIKVNGEVYEVEVEVFEKEGSIEADNSVKSTSNLDYKCENKGELIKSPMQGNILSLKVKKGDKVEKGDVLLILEAMKMENEIISGVSGIVDDIFVSEGKSVNSEEVLLVIK